VPEGQDGDDGDHRDSELHGVSPQRMQVQAPSCFT